MKDKFKVTKNHLKKRGKEFQVRKVGIILIVVQASNGFRNPTKIIIILIITKKNHRIKGLIRLEVPLSLQEL